MEVAVGYAVTADDKILVKTVSPTRTAAQVNWLCVYCGKVPMWQCTAGIIDRAFQDNAKAHSPKIEVVEVAIGPRIQGKRPVITAGNRRNREVG